MVFVEILFLAIESIVVLTIPDAEHFTDPPSFLSIYHSGRDLCAIYVHLSQNLHIYYVQTSNSFLKTEKASENLKR